MDVDVGGWTLGSLSDTSWHSWGGWTIWNQERGKNEEEELGGIDCRCTDGAHIDIAAPTLLCVLPPMLASPVQCGMACPAPTPRSLHSSSL